MSGRNTPCSSAGVDCVGLDDSELLNIAELFPWGNKETKKAVVGYIQLCDEAWGQKWKQSQLSRGSGVSVV